MFTWSNLDTAWETAVEVQVLASRRSTLASQRFSTFHHQALDSVLLVIVTLDLTTCAPHLSAP